MADSGAPNTHAGSSVNNEQNREASSVDGGHDFSDEATVLEQSRIHGSSLGPDTAKVFGRQYAADTKKKRSRLRLSDDVKVDSGYASLDGMNDVKTQIKATLSTIQDNRANMIQLDLCIRLPSECLEVAVDGIELQS